MTDNPADWAIRHLSTVLDIVENEIRVGDNDRAERLRETLMASLEVSYSLVYELDQTIQRDGFVPQMIEPVDTETDGTFEMTPGPIVGDDVAQAVEFVTTSFPADSLDQATADIKAMVQDRDEVFRRPAPRIERAAPKVEEFEQTTDGTINWPDPPPARLAGEWMEDRMTELDRMDTGDTYHDFEGNT